MRSSACGVTPSGSRSATSPTRLARRRERHAVNARDCGRSPTGSSPSSSRRLRVVPAAAARADARPVCEAAGTRIVPLHSPALRPLRRPASVWRTISRGAALPAVPAAPSAITRCRGDRSYTRLASRHRSRVQVRRPPIARAALGRRMRESGADLLGDADAVVPVPLHRRRRRARGFNQAEELARHLGLPSCGRLRRRRTTPRRPTCPRRAATPTSATRSRFAAAYGRARTAASCSSTT